MSEPQPDRPEGPRTGRPRVVPRGSRPRRPKLVPFLLSGAVLGAFIGMVISVLGPSSGVASAGQELIVLGITGGVIGGVVGAVAFLVAEWTTLR